MKYSKVCVSSLVFIILCFAIEIKKATREPLPVLRGDEEIPVSVIPYVGGHQPPDEQIGTTTFDYQANGSFGQRLTLDGYAQIHVSWMYCGDVYPGNPRYIMWNFRDTDGVWFGATQAAPSVSGFCQLDVTRDLNPDSQKTVIAYHYADSSWIDIDSFNGSGSWPHDPKTPGYAGYIWPYVAVVNNGNIVMAARHASTNTIRVSVTTDEGETWTLIADFDSCSTVSQFVRSSINPGSNKVVFAHTQFITDTLGYGQRDNDVYYMLSTDGGMTWGPHINITNYQPYPIDSVRAYMDVNAIFDLDDNLHIVWTGRKVTDYYYEASKIFHWDEVHDAITVVNSPSWYYYEPGGWWVEVENGGEYGFGRLPADEPQLAVDGYNKVYCLWHGNADTADYSASGYVNGELYAAWSPDGGITWTDYINITNTPSPGAGPGDCYDEDYMTVYPIIFPHLPYIDVYLTYIEDKDAGAAIMDGTAWTENPVRCWAPPPGIFEEESALPDYSVLEVHPNPFSNMTNIKYRIADNDDITIKIYDITGKLVKDFERIMPIIWDGTDNTDKKVPGGIYFLKFEAGDYTETRKLILLR